MSTRTVLTDAMWARIEPLLPQQKGPMGPPFRAHRPVVEGAIYRLRTGVPWRDLPAEYGAWHTVHRRHQRGHGAHHHRPRRPLPVPDAILGAIVLATVTGIPNLVAAIRLARLGRGSAVVSESLNSNTLNIVVGLVIPALLVAPAHHQRYLTSVRAIWLVALTAAALALLGRRGGLSRAEGLAVIAGYLAYVGVVVMG